MMFLGFSMQNIMKLTPEETHPQCHQGNTFGSSEAIFDKCPQSRVLEAKIGQKITLGALSKYRLNRPKSIALIGLHAEFDDATISGLSCKEG